MHYLIWIPEGRSLESVGLADHAEQGEKMLSPGPGGAQGILITWRRNSPGDFYFDPSKQDWIPAAQDGEWAKGRYWVGLWKDKYPTPQNLVRPYPYSGETVELGDETKSSWLVPRALELPQNLILMDDGSTRFEVQRRFHAFWNRAIDIASRLADGIPFSECREFCTDTLRVNYRLTPEVASAMRLFSNVNVRNVINVVAGVRDG